ncbi:DNA-binding protein [Shewanella sp. SR44-4]|jgi:predicted DNA-binding transcriptional regulator AlpA|uniref:DNA-binding protein n=1 Tax=Shewanella sp. SR44-4 TaxID=2760935 RepID=UPI001601B6D0|nr:DNA-binding protein [Shewanella sp. SR44-4]MBB1362137.1 DNA-binding protein [Shewanella sp. SR44-4]
MSQFTFQIDAPFVSSEEYARRVGISVRTVRSLISDGRLPIRPKLKPQERPFINMLAVAKEAAELAAL